MARSRKRRGGSRKRSADWVYRPTLETGVPWGAYNGSITQNVVRNDIVLGVVNSGHFILYDSEAYMTRTAQDSFALAQAYPAAARAEGRRPSVLQVEGQMHFRLGAWTTGNTTMWGIRLGWFEQDQATGFPSIEPDYSMFEPQIATGAVRADNATFANDRVKNIREWMFVRTYGDTGTIPTSSLTINVRFPRGRTAPSSNHCLMLYMEVSGQVTPLNGSVFTWCNVRSLISDPNS